MKLQRTYEEHPTNGDDLRRKQEHQSLKHHSQYKPMDISLPLLITTKPDFTPILGMRKLSGSQVE